MEIMVSDLISIALFVFGLYTFFTGKLSMEYGFTGPNGESSTKFLVSKQRDLSGKPARVIAVIFMVLGVIGFIAFSAGDVVFKI